MTTHDLIDTDLIHALFADQELSIEAMHYDGTEYTVPDHPDEVNVFAIYSRPAYEAPQFESGRWKSHVIDCATHDEALAVVCRIDAACRGAQLSFPFTYL